VLSASAALALASVVAPGSQGPGATSPAPSMVDETPEQREQRLIREGIRKPPEPEVTPRNDYLSVLKRQLEPEGKVDQRPPLLWFGFGFASHFPMMESPGRSSTPLGAHHVFGQIWAWSSEQPENEAMGSQSSASLHAFALASHHEISVLGRVGSGPKVKASILVSDLDAGVVYRSDRLWSRSGASVFGWSSGWMVGYLPLRQRQLVRYGEAQPVASDLRTSQIQWNHAGVVTRVSLSLLALSVFEATAFAGVVLGAPFEARLWTGLEMALRAPRSEPGATP
jgi:hypothetical protein